MDVKEIPDKLADKLPGLPADYRLAFKSIATTFGFGVFVSVVDFFRSPNNYTIAHLKEFWPVALAAGFGALGLKFTTNSLLEWKYQRAREKGEFYERRSESRDNGEKL